MLNGDVQTKQQKTENDVVEPLKQCFEQQIFSLIFLFIAM